MGRTLMIVAMLWVAAGWTSPCHGKSYAWKDGSGDIQLSNIPTLVPGALKQAEKMPEKRHLPIQGGNRPSGPAAPDTIRSDISAVDRTLEQLEAGLEGMENRNRNVLKLKEWFFKLMKDPKQFNNPKFREWMQGVARDPVRRNPVQELMPVN